FHRADRYTRVRRARGDTQVVVARVGHGSVDTRLGEARPGRTAPRRGRFERPVNVFDPGPDGHPVRCARRGPRLFGHGPRLCFHAYGFRLAAGQLSTHPGEAGGYDDVFHRRLFDG